MPRVSVIIPTYNCERYLGRAIESALKQSYTDHEILIVDDGSTDNTGDLLDRYGSKIRHFRQSNRGVSAARNLALSHATGEFIAYLDADDMWYPQKLESQVAFLDIQKQCGLVHTEVSVIDEDDHIVHRCFNDETQRFIPQGHCLADMLRRCHIQTLTVLERRECVNRAGLFDERLPIAQDYQHWIKVALEGFAIGYLPDPLGKYRWRHGSLMGNQRRFLEDLVVIYESLLEENRIIQNDEGDMLQIVSQELFLKHCQLAYLERAGGKYGLARKRMRQLIRNRPGTVGLYVEFLKACAADVLDRGRKMVAGNASEIR